MTLILIYMNPKIQKLKSEKEKLLAKKASIEERCDEIDAQVMELENLDIIGTVREMGITPDQLAELLKKILPLETKNGGHE